MSLDPRHKSRTLLDGRDRAPARSYLKAIGFSDADLARPIVGIANTWTETMPCNFHLRRLAEKVKEGVRAAGATPMEFNTVAISTPRAYAATSGDSPNGSAAASAGARSLTASEHRSA